MYHQVGGESTQALSHGIIRPKEIITLLPVHRACDDGRVVRGQLKKKKKTSGSGRGFSTDALVVTWQVIDSF